MEKPKNKAKSLKLGKNDIICPSCNSVLNISEELKNDELIQCTKCDAAINNPLFFSGKFVICQNCGNNAELPRHIENELIINCGGCGNDFYNPHSGSYNPIVCPYCYFESHVPSEMLNERYFECLNCKNNFKNTLRPKKKINIENQKKSYTQQDLTSNIEKTIIDEGITSARHLENEITNDNNPNEDDSAKLKEKQGFWLAIILISIFVIIVILGSNKDGRDFKEQKTTIEKNEEIRGPEIIYTEIRKALIREDTKTCETLYNEMLTKYPNSALFESVAKTYESALHINQIRETKASEKSESNNTNKIKEKTNTVNIKTLKAFAQAYNDGVLSCNVYLVDKSGNISYLDATSISYNIYSFQNSRINPTGNASTSNTNSGLFIDIPLGTRIFEAKTISFVIKTSKGVSYKSNSVSIEYE